MVRLKVRLNKHFAVVAAFFIFMGLFLVGGAQIAKAQSFKTGDNITVEQNQTINQTVFAAGRTIDINSQVNGDIFCAGQNITISGTVNGDVICAGQTVNVTGTVNGNVRLAGQTVTLGANVTGNATVGGQTVTINSNSKIGGDLSLGATTATINGQVGRDVAAGSSDLVISGTIGRNLQASGEKLTISSSGQVKGNVDYKSNNNASISDQAAIGGKVTRTTPAKAQPSKHWAVFGFGVFWFLFWFFSMLVTALVLALLFPRAFHAASEKGLPRPWKALLTGFLAHLAMPFLLVLLAITVVGIPLALILGLLWFVAFILSGPVFGYLIGRWVLRDSKQPLLIMLVGASILLVSYFVPVIGFFAFLAAVWIGTGCIVLELFQRTPKPSYNLARANGTSKTGR